MQEELDRLLDHLGSFKRIWEFVGGFSSAAADTQIQCVRVSLLRDLQVAGLVRAGFGYLVKCR